MFELCKEHGRYAEKGGAAFRGDCVKSQTGVEGIGGKDDASAMRECVKEAHYEPEAVEQWRWAADDVGGGEVHSCADKAAIVEYISVVV